MKSIILLLVLVFVASSFQVQVEITDPVNSIESKYVVAFHKNVDKTQRTEYFKALFKSFQLSNDTVQNSIHKMYSIGAFNGFAAQLSPSVLEQVKSSPLIRKIEQQYKVFAIQACGLQTGATWGIDRVGEELINLDGRYQYDASSGENVDSYVIDTGININHVDFEGRAIWGANFADDDTDTDCNGHGTHVAGTMGSATYGIAKQTTLFAVKVLACSGSGTNQGVIDGIEWVVNSAQTRKRPSVANMSLGGSKSTMLNEVVTEAVNAGVTFVVAAGNENADSCTKSPASTPDAITVGATGVDNDNGKQIDNRAYFSNYGSCNTLFAPGLNIQSTWIGPNNNEIKTISGTSMASPHVAGIVALHLGTGASSDPADVKKWLINNSKSGQVHFECDGAKNPSACEITKDRFVYSPCVSA